jgi:hypothetical protein
VKHRKLPHPFTDDWIKNGFNMLTPAEARRLIYRAEDGEFDLDHVRSEVKHLIGESWDGNFDSVRGGLWRLTDMLTIVKLVKRKPKRKP